MTKRPNEIVKPIHNTKDYSKDFKYQFKHTTIRDVEQAYDNVNACREGIDLKHQE